MKNNSHGGNIYKKARELELRESEILDFSANISPLGLPGHIRKAMERALDGTINYPDPDCRSLRESIAGRDGVEYGHITCGNGGADILYRIAFGMRPKNVLLPVPAFIEYEEAMTAAGAKMIYYAMAKDYVIREDFLEQITDEIDLVILCNPNNPTGLLTPRELILRIVEKAAGHHCFVLVDECFLEICQDESHYTVKPYIRGCKNLMILKSFTKLYAIPGVRLGYLLSSDSGVIGSVNRAGQAWSVNYIAQQAGIAALEDPLYKEKVIRAVREELAYMKEELGKLPIELCDGQANYLFFRAPGVTDLDAQMERKGIMIRNCSNYVNLGKDCWRVAVKARPDNVRLIRALEDALL